jgi:hypothetical protein
MKHARIGRLLWLALVFVAVVARVSAQDKNAKPDFNGTWKVDLPATAKANGKAAEPGTPLTIRVATDDAQNVVQNFTLAQTDTTLIVKVQGRPDVLYTLDNKEKKSEVTTRGGKIEVIVKAKWDGAKILVSTVQRAIVEGELREVENQETRSIDKEGRLNFTMSTSTGRGNYKAIYVKDAPAQ